MIMIYSLGKFTHLPDLVFGQIAEGAVFHDFGRQMVQSLPGMWRWRLLQLDLVGQGA